MPGSLAHRLSRWGRPRAGRRCVLALAGPALAVLACGGGEPSAPPAAPPEPAPPGLARPAPAPGGSPRIALRPGRIDLEAAEAPLGPLLERLSRALGFELEVRARTLPLVSLRLEDASLPVAVDRLLAGVSYRAEFAPDPLAPGHRLVRLRVGGVPPARRAPPPEGRNRGDPQGEARRAAPEPDPGPGRALERLEHPDPDVRAAAVLEIDPDEPAGLALVALAREDPDPRVRRRAVEQLADGESHAGIAALLDALEDPDSGVVLAAVEGLAAVGDPTTRGALEPLQDSPDPALRDAAVEALDLLD